MSDLIDRQVAIERIVKIRPSTPKQSDYSHGVDVGMAMAIVAIKEQPSAQSEMIREIRRLINSGNRGNADYFIVDKIEEIINKYE